MVIGVVVVVGVGSQVEEAAEVEDSGGEVVAIVAEDGDVVLKLSVQLSAAG